MKKIGDGFITAFEGKCHVYLNNLFYGRWTIFYTFTSEQEKRETPKRWNC